MALRLSAGCMRNFRDELLRSKVQIDESGQMSRSDYEYFLQLLKREDENYNTDRFKQFEQSCNTKYVETQFISNIAFLVTLAYSMYAIFLDTNFIRGVLIRAFLTSLEACYVQNECNEGFLKHYFKKSLYESFKLITMSKHYFSAGFKKNLFEKSILDSSGGDARQTRITRRKHRRGKARA